MLHSLFLSEVNSLPNVLYCSSGLVSKHMSSEAELKVISEVMSFEYICSLATVNVHSCHKLKTQPEMPLLAVRARSPRFEDLSLHIMDTF